MFTESNGDRSRAPNYLIILTDGKANDGEKAIREADAAKAQNITILTVSCSG